MADEPEKENDGKHSAPKRGVKVPRIGEGRAGPGRPPGIPNKLTIELKAMIEGALADIGGQDWLASAATREPAAFMSLLGKLLPKDVNLKGSLDLKSMSLEEIKAEIARLLPQLQATSEPTSESDLC
ncbi:hypothetical protein UFOVP1077_29 [uncultured Caudovirales phage]|uniref:Uncharacterized protein n=1 Tax=uncultured Caudovirales phage TaxID=2100421 RepID=A0A6J5RYZ6_9CAUD|nr:hypothetical protein UFOVP1077_29 [uncultured Caudovirales phage]CAB4197525.1 hypothetical protein UFOVP1316_17 [uncultured Caudovirales phage]CAB4211392.1 hypothetical protein UFOVP1428_26 [uncultured Caudovirales phage]CAB5227206.1 hypothetical protein UFOVP1526_18 [uncultured Caudovirales phage]